MPAIQSERITPAVGKEKIEFRKPEKLVNVQKDMSQWELSLARRRLGDLVTTLSQSVAGIETPSGPKGEIATTLVDWLHDLKSLAADIEPSAERQRFGNEKFRDWIEALDHHTSKLRSTADALAQGAWIELHWYLSNSFGSATRLDFGTGHELNFLAFIGAMIALGAPLKGADLLAVFSEYYSVARLVITRYNLEPAGSHGVWGLDDHFYLIYVLGASQLAPVSDQLDLSPKAVLDRKRVHEAAPINLYFSAINFIYEIKRGNFFEHSPLLFDVSAIQRWSKIKQGMIKMYYDEVLGKFPVVQHFWFGGLYPFK